MSNLISPTLKINEGDKVATFAAGCFWGVENVYRKRFGDRFTDAKVGFANGNSSDYANPSYKTVRAGGTDFAEGIQILYDPKKLLFRELVEFFFVMHDPTHLNHQGPNEGTQYRTGIFVNDDAELAIAKEELEKAQKKWYPNHKIVSVIEKLQNFYDAEDYHQKYLIKNPTGYECPTHFIRTTPKQ